MKRNVSILITCAIILIIIMVVRCMAFSILSVPHDTQRPMLRAGDRILVRQWAYGMHLPWWKSGERKHSKLPLQGDWVAFEVQTIPGPQIQKGIGCLMACPGDTIWMGPQYRVSPARDYSRGCIWPLIVPSKGNYIEVAPWNAELYARTINNYEGAKISVEGDRLNWNGRTYRRFRFHKDYYWVYSGNDNNLQDSRSMGFLPQEAIIGQATTLLYSFDPQKPFYRSLRTDRLFKPLGGKP